MTLSIGMAIKITKVNHKKISIVNGGIVPLFEEETTYFVLPYDYDSHVEILKEADFRKKYQFANTENENYFVDIDEL